MMLSMLSMYEQNRNDLCFLCSNTLSDIKSYPNDCEHLFHYKCLRNYVDNRLEKNEAIICPICNKIFHQIANKYKKSKEVLYQNVILSNDETQCCICFSKYKCPVASTDTCSHTFCFECIKKWCTFKHECPMDRMPIKLLLMSDFPGGHIIKKEEPPPIEQDLNGDGDNDEILNTTCEICNLGNNDHLLLLCDNCNRGYHIYCLTTPLSEIPEGDWFCDECSNDMVVNNQGLPRGIRGLHRVIDDLQVRYASANRNRANRNQTNVSRRNRTRALRNPVSEDSDWDDEVSDQRVRQRNLTRSAFDTGQDGIRRSLRNRRVNSEEEVLPALRSNGHVIRNRRRVIEDSEEEPANPPPITDSNADTEFPRNLSADRTRSRRRTTVQFNETESPGGRNRQGSLSSEPESEIEPAKKKAKLAESSSSSSEDEEESSEEGTSATRLQVTTRKRARDTAIEDVTAADDDDDCPLPRPGKKARLLEESSVSGNDNDSSECEESSESSECTNDDVDEEDDDELDERKRHISTSSSLSTIPCRSSAPTIPTTVALRREAVKLESKKKIRQCAKVEDVFSDSSNADNTDSDYTPECERTLRQPSTSSQLQPQPSTSRKTPVKVRKKVKKTRKSAKKKKTNSSGGKKKKRKTSKKKLKRKSSKRNDSIEARETRTPQRLSIFGREKQLPVVSDEEMSIKRVTRHPPITVAIDNDAATGVGGSSGVGGGSSSTHVTCSVNILSEITEAQSNFRHISLSTITRLPSGHLVHRKTPAAAAESRENKDPARTSNAISTGSSNSGAGTGGSGAAVAPSTSAAPRHEQQCHNIHRQSAAVTAPVTAPILLPPRKRDSDDNRNGQNGLAAVLTSGGHHRHQQPRQLPLPPPPPQQPQQQPHQQPQSIANSATRPIAQSTNEPQQPPVATPTLCIDEIRKVIVKFLKQDEYREKISRDENKMLSERIIEKIMKRNNQQKTPGASSVRDFSRKYLEFYLKKKK